MSINFPKSKAALNIVFASISTALVCIATMLFQVYVPATKGFFNIGESMVFLSAILFGPLVGAFAGGFGSMLADLLLGYYYYAPATLVIKASEGFIVGFLSSHHPKLSLLKWKMVTTVLGVLIGVFLVTIGAFYYSGEVELTIGQITTMLNIPTMFWVGLGLIATISMATVGLFTEPEAGWMILSVVTGGFIMVLGYFIYQMFLIGPLFGIEAFAIAEVPINVGQMTVGSIIAIPAVKIIRKFFR